MVRRRWVAVVGVSLATLLLIAAYTAAAVYKAIDYTTTPGAQASDATPSDVGLAYENVSLPAADGLKLSAWWIPNPVSARAVILIHGRYETKAAHLALARPLWQAGFGVLLVDLRGHGASAASSCFYGLRELRDVQGAAAYLVRRGYQGSAIGVIGWSLGATSALLALEHTPAIAAVVSDSAYANGEPLLARNLLRPGLRLALRLVRGVDLDAIQPARVIAAVPERRVLVIHGARDRAVPVEHAQLLVDAAAQGNVESWIVSEAGHIQAFALHPEEYARRVIEFFDSALAARTHERGLWSYLRQVSTA